MSTEPQRTCPTCGNELSGAMELCPVCMFRQGLAGGAESGESSASEDTIKRTTMKQAVQRFEHYQLVRFLRESHDKKTAFLRIDLLPPFLFLRLLRTRFFR